MILGFNAVRHMVRCIIEAKLDAGNRYDCDMVAYILGQGSSFRPLSTPPRYFLTYFPRLDTSTYHDLSLW